MRKLLFLTVSSLGLAIGGAAVAQQPSTGATPGAQTPSSAQSPSLPRSQAQTPALPGSQTQQTVQPGVTGTQSQQGTAGRTGATTPGMNRQQARTAESEGFRAYSEISGDEREKVSLSGDWEAGDLRDATVVDADGDEVGTVEDLLVTGGNEVERVIIDISEVSDKDEHFVAVEIDRLEKADESGQVKLDMSRDEVESEFGDAASFEKQDDRWTRARS